ncbi:DUF1801 domain-containing protein [Phytohabitans rumicis]|uniref:DUF1801 domain-containing protein n=1 Tax=Phytohabitans rumicis TaxID=1076125 RepID=UPI002483D839|nr:DUF1801 domain-containing protein [Phytohabitans rumicis]
MPEPRRGDVQLLHELIRREAPELAPYVQSGMLGYGSYHYRYDSGREGDWFVVGLAGRKAYVSLYVSATVGDRYLAETYRDRLPKADIGRSCVRIKRLSDVNLDTVAALIREAAQTRPDSSA